MSSTFAYSNQVDDLRPIIRCGIDLVDHALFAHAVDRGGTHFLERLFTPSELLTPSDVDDLAWRFALKEATSKALGTGFRGISWHDIEIVCEGPIRRGICLHGNAAMIADRLCLSAWSNWHRHRGDYHFALVIAVGCAGSSSNRTLYSQWLLTSLRQLSSSVQKTLDQACDYTADPESALRKGQAR